MFSKEALPPIESSIFSFVCGFTPVGPVEWSGAPDLALKYSSSIQDALHSTQNQIPLAIFTRGGELALPRQRRHRGGRRAATRHPVAPLQPPPRPPAPTGGTQLPCRLARSPFAPLSLTTTFFPVCCMNPHGPYGPMGSWALHAHGLYGPMKALQSFSKALFGPN